MILKKIKNNTLRSIKNLWAVLLLLKTAVLFGQNDTLLLGSGEMIAPLNPPTHVAATDGQYADRIDISWQYSGGDYQVFRSDHVNATGKLISTGWQRTNYFSDRSALQSGKNYFYRVKMRRNGRESNFSTPDVGYLMPVAGGRILENDSLSSTPNIQFSMGTLAKDTITKESPFDLTFSIENKGISATKSLNVRFYLAKQETYDKDAIFLNQENIPPLSIGRIRRGAVGLIIPKAVTNGSYFLIMKIDKSPLTISKRIEVK